MAQKTNNRAAVALIAVAVMASAFQADGFAQGRLYRRIAKCSRVIEMIRSPSGTALPYDLMKECTAIAVFPDTVKSGFIIGERYGQGVVMFHDPAKDLWSAPTFATISDVKWGFQLGWKTADIVVLFYGEKAQELLLEGDLHLGKRIKLTRIYKSGAEQAGQGSAAMAFTIKNGVTRPAAVTFAELIPNNSANMSFYGADVTRREIMIGGRLQVPEEAGKLSAMLAGPGE